MGHFASTEYLPRTLSKKADWEGAVKKPAPSLPKKKKGKCGSRPPKKIDWEGTGKKCGLLLRWREKTRRQKCYITVTKVRKNIFKYVFFFKISIDNPEKNVYDADGKNA